MGGITPEGKLYLMVQEWAYRGADVVGFLKHLARHIVGKLLVLWDGAPVHRSRVRFKGPTSDPLLVFTNRRAVIFNKAWFEAGGEEAMFQDASVGTGAFRWAPGQKVGVDTQHFERNPDYFFGDGTLPYVDQLTVVGIVDESAQRRL
jgi:hypothetical protein